MKKINMLLLINLLMLIAALLIFNLDNFSNIDTKLYKIFYLVINILCFVSIISLKNYKLSFLFGLYFISFNIFLNSRVFLDIFGYYEFGKIEMYYSILKNFDENIIKEIYSCLILSVIFLNFGHILGVSKFFSQKKSSNSSYDPSLYDPSLYKISVKIFYIFIFISLIGNLVLAQQVFFKGYSSFVSGEIERVIFFMKAQVGSIYFFIIVHMSKPPLKKLKRIYYVYIFYIITFLFIGQRGAFFTNLGLIIFLWNSNIKEIKIKSFIKYILILPITAQFFSFYRSYIGKISLNVFFKNILGSYITFFYEQGISVLVIGYAAFYKEELKLNIVNQYFYPFLVSLPFSPFKYQSFSIIDNMLSFQHQLSALSKLNEYKYIYNGLGANYIAENYIMGGLILVSLINFGVGYLSVYLEKIGNKKYGIFLQVICIPYILFLPRGETLQLLSALVNSGIKFTLILILLKIILNNKNNARSLL